MHLASAQHNMQPKTLQILYKEGLTQAQSSTFLNTNSHSCRNSAVNNTCFLCNINCFQKILLHKNRYLLLNPSPTVHENSAQPLSRFYSFHASSLPFQPAIYETSSAQLLNCSAKCYMLTVSPLSPSSVRGIFTQQFRTTAVTKPVARMSERDG